MMLDSCWQSRSAHLIVWLFAVVLISGCGGSSTPEIVKQTVTVKTPQGEAINNVLVRFVPSVDGLDGNYIASGVTDDSGSCELSLPGKSEPGCCACEHKIQIKEGPVPDAARAAYGSDEGASIASFNRSLKHRPLPKKYELLSSTPLTFTPTGDGEPYEIVLSK